MKAITSLTALVLGASLAGMAWAQTETTPPADAGAGAAAAVSGDAAAEAPADAAAAETAADAAAEVTETAAAGAHVLPNGQDMTRSRSWTAAGAMTRAFRPSRSRMASSISRPSTVSAAITRNAMSATVLTARGRPMPPR